MPDVRSITIIIPSHLYDQLPIIIQFELYITFPEWKMIRQSAGSMLDLKDCPCRTLHNFTSDYHVLTLLFWHNVKLYVAIVRILRLARLVDPNTQKWQFAVNWFIVYHTLREIYQFQESVLSNGIKRWFRKVDII